MKRYITFILIACFVLSLSSCAQGNEDSSFVFEDPIGEYDDSEIFYEDNSGTSDTVNENGIVVKQKQYDYNGNDIVILNVENLTDKDYTIKINCVYMDANGKEIGRETKTFEGFAAGWQNYFVFSPNKAFDTFNYTLDVEEFSGIALSKYLETKGKVKIDTSKTYMDGDGNFYDQPHIAISASFQVANTYDKELYYAADFIVFSSKDELYYIDTLLMEDSITPVEDGKSPLDYRLTRYIAYPDALWEDNDSYTLPEELQGDILGIVCVRSVSDTSKHPQ